MATTKEWNFEFDLNIGRKGSCRHWEYIVERPLMETPITIFDFATATTEEKRDAMSMIRDGFSCDGIAMPVIKTRRFVLCKVKMREETNEDTFMVERHYRLWLLPQSGTIADTVKQIGYWNVIFGYDAIEARVTEQMNISFENVIMEN